MSAVEDHEIAGLGFTNKDKSSEITKFALEHLSSDAENKVIQNSDFAKDDIYWVTGLEILDALVVKRFCYSTELRNIVSNLKNRMYLSRISLKRQGRKEITDMVKSEVSYMGMMPQMKEQLK